jgi:hypothetical protein
MRSESLTLPAEYDTNATVVCRACGWLIAAPAPTRRAKIPPGEDGMDFEKDNFEDETELSPLEDEELGGDGDGLVETEEEELIISEVEPEEEAVPKPAAKPASKPAAKKVAPKPKKAAVKKAPAKKAKKAGAKKPAKKAKKAAKKKKKKR